MSILYPRLLAAQARPLYEEYRSMEVGGLTARAAFSHEASVYVATGGDRVPVETLRQLRAAVLEHARQAGFPGNSDRTRNTEFDLRVAALLHSRSGMVPAEAASRDVWPFLALVLLPDVAFWRYPKPPRDRILGTDLTRHVFGRLWWRAQLVRSSDPDDPYRALDILGEAAFDQIYARRAALGGSPHLVRSILRVWQHLDLTGFNERDVLRDFLKRLLRLAPFLLFDGVGDQELDEELRMVAQESIDAQRSSTGFRTGSGNASSPAAEPVLIQVSGVDAPDSVKPQAPPGTARLRSFEVCAGSGAQALGLEAAGFDPVLLLDTKDDACRTITDNRPNWNVACSDVERFRPEEHPVTIGVDLLSGGLPRVKSMAATARSGDGDERRTLRAVVALVSRIEPRAVLLENVSELVESPDFAADRSWIESRLAASGFRTTWRTLNAQDFGVPQNRKSGFLVALREPHFSRFSWPAPHDRPPATVGELLGPSMAANGWPGAEQWIKKADGVAPALVGGSDRRGGADLGPTGSKRAWAALGVNGSSLGDSAPGTDFPIDDSPRITVEQAALIQAIPAQWTFHGGKTSRYRQVGHAMPPPLATAVGSAVASALRL